MYNSDLDNYICITQNKIKGYNSDLYNLMEYYIRRSIFKGQVIKTISEKKQSIIANTHFFGGNVMENLYTFFDRRIEE